MRRVLLLAVVMQALACSWGTVSPEDFKKELGIQASTADRSSNAPARRCPHDKR